MIYVRIHRAADDIILAACDEDVLGKTFTGDEMRITVSERFYNGELVPEPILQNGKLVGAVTHVLVNNPTTGYGIFLENMLARMPVVPERG